MNKCIILCMCCNEPQYVRERLLICDTWGRHVLDGEYENLDLWFYTSGYTTSIDIDNHIIYINTSDNFYNTWEKTRHVFEILNKYFDYDFIFRTNCSTVVNCQLLSAFINTLNKESNDMWSWVLCDYIYQKTNIRLFDFYHFYGFSMLFSKAIINQIIEAIQYSEIIYRGDEQYITININTEYEYFNKDIIDDKMKIADDIIIGYLLCQYCKHNDIDFMQHYKQYPTYFYKVFEKNTYFWNGRDLGYDVADISYYGDCLCVRAKNENGNIDDCISRQQITEQSIYELSKMYETKLSDETIQQAIKSIYENCNKKDILYTYM